MNCYPSTRWTLGLALIVSVSIAAIATAAAPPVDLAALTGALNRAGYAVQQGKMAFLELKEGAPMYFGNNPTSPYGLYLLPPAPGEYRSASAATSFLPVEGDLWPVWRLRADEAIVMVGSTPPECRYFGYRSYLFSRDNGRGGRSSLFASLGDSLNHLKIAAVGKPAGGAGVPFDRLTAVVTAADRGVVRDVTDAIESAGLDRSIVNADVIPALLPLRMGLNSKSDEFMMLHRVALFASESRRQEYLADPGVIVLRLTPIGTRKLDPYPTPTLATHGTGTTEQQLQPGVERALDELERAVIARHRGLAVERLAAFDLTPLVGYECIRKGYPCLGDNTDTTYTVGALGVKLQDDPDDFLMVLSVDHHALGKSLYSNVSVYRVKTMLGVASVTDDALAGSAAAYLPRHPSRNDLLVCRISRRPSSEPGAMVVGTDFPGVPPGEGMAVTVRAYVEPQTQVAPAYSEIVKPRVLHFSRRGRRGR